MDLCLEILNEIDSSINLKYNKFYIGLTNKIGVNNFIVFRARKQHILVDAYGLDGDDKMEWHKKFEDSDITLLPDDSYSAIRLKLHMDELQKYRLLIKELFAFCYNKVLY